MRIILGLGSNIGDREDHLRQACVSLRNRNVDVRRSASLYLTEPRDFLAQPWFINTVVHAETKLPPLELMEVCLEIEREAGRVRNEIGGPRPIDIDVIVYGELQIDTPGLTIPHPRYAERRFVLLPLAELAPDFRDPLRGLSIQQLIAQCPDTGSVQLHAPPLF